MISNYANKVMDYEYNMFMSLMHVSVSKHLFDEHFTVLWANDYFYELIGYTKEEYDSRFHKHVDEYYKNDPESVAVMTEVIVKAYEAGEPGYEFECRMPVNGGKMSWIRVTGRFTDELKDGIPVIYTIYTDITDLKNMQMALEERTLKMQEALEMAERANQAKSDFLSRMSHDIRTPMNAIIGMAEIASGHLTEPRKISNCLEQISLSSQHLLGLINDVLDMSKIESGKMTLNRQQIYLPEVLRKIVAIMQPSIKAKNQKFSVHLHNVKHEYFLSDPLRLRQVFINILSNASKFTPEEGEICLAVEECEEEQDHFTRFRFVFSDTGIGMSPEFTEHIFDAFTREEDSRVDKTEGTGLGMAITKKIVELFEGTLTVKSEPGKGTEFTVELPLRVLNQISESPMTPLPDLNVLIADDDLIMCEYTVKMLEEMGIHSDWVDNGAAAVRKIDEKLKNGQRYDAIILDWHMPRMDGLKTSQMIRQKFGKNLPILIISAYDWSDIEDDALSAGISGFLAKPIFPSSLYQCVKQYVLQEETDANVDKKDYDFSGKRILLVEDNDLNRDIAVELLSDTGVLIETACDGADAAAKFEQSCEFYYDLILMDVQMPVMDGYSATRKIRSLGREDAKAIPVLAMTADVFMEDIIAAEEAGMNGHLAKPLDIKMMKQQIDQFLNQDA